MTAHQHQLGRLRIDFSKLEDLRSSLVDNQNRDIPPPRRVTGSPNWIELHRMTVPGEHARTFHDPPSAFWKARNAYSALRSNPGSLATKLTVVRGKVRLAGAVTSIERTPRGPDGLPDGFAPRGGDVPPDGGDTCDRPPGAAEGMGTCAFREGPLDMVAPPGCTVPGE